VSKTISKRPHVTTLEHQKLELKEERARLAELEARTPIDSAAIQESRERIALLEKQIAHQ
jgi:hypothetical protein